MKLFNGMTENGTLLGMVIMLAVVIGLWLGIQ